MSDKTNIEWTDSTWNPITGCTKVSPGCDHCYAETIAHRFAGTPAYPNGFAVTLRPERLDQPLRWKRPRRVFVNSMSDLFHAEIPDDYIAKVFAVMVLARQHTFQVLTKRPGRMRSLLASGDFRDRIWYQAGLAALTRTKAGKLTVRPGLDSSSVGVWPLPNVWLGVSAENQRWADVRIPVLLDTPSAVRFVSAEPLLGPIDFNNIGGVCALGPDWVGGPGGGSGAPHPLLDWVIVGGESGPGSRPMHADWARQIRDDCERDEVAFLFKQWGSHDHEGHRVNKKTAGRLLDGVSWDGYPEAAA